jgi:hypothetical protein
VAKRLGGWDVEEFAAGMKSSAHLLHLLAQETHSVLM